jgi:glutathione synthase/RimK-type ligase-like ATP-grasp enzyme
MKVLYDKVTINAEKDNADFLLIDQRILDRWQVKNGEKIFLQAGNKQISISVQPISLEKPELIMPEHIHSTCFLPMSSSPISIHYSPESRVLRIGPFFTFLTNHTPKEADGTFGEMDLFLKELHALCTEKGYYFYVLQPKLFQTHAEGFSLMNDKWERMNLPLPDVIYNRIGSRKLENSAPFQEFIKITEAYSIPLFNCGFLSKLEVHELLSADESLLPFLPETIPFQSEEAFVSFLENHKAIYIKPAFGSQGRNICKLTTTAEGWVLEHSGNPENTRLENSEEQLYSLLKRNIKIRSFIVQQGIPLLEIDHQKTDFRVLLNKNNEHDWIVTSMVARTGYAGHIVSNLARGGEMKNAWQFLSSIFDRNTAVTMYKKLASLALHIAKTISSNHTGLFGELGVDLALDSDNRPWIIEVNSKPSKTFQTNSDKIRPSAKKIIEYSYALYTKKVEAPQ